MTSASFHVKWTRPRSSWNVLLHVFFGRPLLRVPPAGVHPTAVFECSWSGRRRMWPARRNLCSATMSSTFSNQTIRVTSHFQTPFKDTLFSVSLSHYLGPRPPMRPDSVPDLGAIQIIYLLTYLLVVPVNSSHGRLVTQSNRHTVNSSQSTRHHELTVTSK